MKQTIAFSDHKAFATFRQIALSIVLMVVTTSAGPTIRFVHLGLPPIIVKYGGSIL